MVRYMCLGLLATCLLLMPISATTAGHPASMVTASAKSNPRIYWVYYRSCSQSPWSCYGGYYKVNQAVAACNYFRYYGYEAFYR